MTNHTGMALVLDSTSGTGSAGPANAFYPKVSRSILSWVCVWRIPASWPSPSWHHIGAGSSRAALMRTRRFRAAFPTLSDCSPTSIMNTRQPSAPLVSRAREKGDASFQPRYDASSCRTIFVGDSFPGRLPRTCRSIRRMIGTEWFPVPIVRIANPTPGSPNTWCSASQCVPRKWIARSSRFPWPQMSPDSRHHARPDRSTWKYVSLRSTLAVFEPRTGRQPLYWPTRLTRHNLPLWFFRPIPSA